MYLDIHAHFADEGYDIPEELQKIRAAGVEKIVLAADSLPHATAHRDIANAEEGVYFTAGVHPSELDGFCDHTLSALKQLCAEEKCVAVGEIGLDYHYPDTDKQAQKEALIKQILLADEVGLPVQIHSRDCALDTLTIVKDMHAHLSHGALLHCYSHGAEMMDDFIKLGFYFSFGGVTCFKNAKKVVESVKKCPLDRILSETDSPYLSPFRGEKNTPANIPVIVKKIAEIKEISVEECARAIRENAERLFFKLK